MIIGGGVFTMRPYRFGIRVHNAPLACLRALNEGHWLRQNFHCVWMVRVLMLDVHMVYYPEIRRAKQNYTHRCVALTSRATG